MRAREGLGVLQKRGPRCRRAEVLRMGGSWSSADTAIRAPTSIFFPAQQIDYLRCSACCFFDSAQLASSPLILHPRDPRCSAQIASVCCGCRKAFGFVDNQCLLRLAVFLIRPSRPRDDFMCVGPTFPEDPQGVRSKSPSKPNIRTWLDRPICRRRRSLPDFKSRKYSFR